jgi:hypothetical protein
MTLELVVYSVLPLTMSSGMAEEWPLIRNFMACMVPDQREGSMTDF